MRRAPIVRDALKEPSLALVRQLLEDCVGPMNMRRNVRAVDSGRLLCPTSKG